MMNLFKLSPLQQLVAAVDHQQDVASTVASGHHMSCRASTATGHQASCRATLVPLQRQQADVMAQRVQQFLFASHTNETGSHLHGEQILA